MSKSRASLIAAYLAALPGTVVRVVASDDGRRSRIETGSCGASEAVQGRLRFKATHAELVLSAIGYDGWCDMPAAELVDLIIRTAIDMGAAYQTEAQLAVAAEAAVGEIVAKVEGMNQAGGLKEINTEYKIYRQRQIAKAEKAMPYAKFLERFTASIVRGVAAGLG